MTIRYVYQDGVDEKSIEIQRRTVPQIGTIVNLHIKDEKKPRRFKVREIIEHTKYEESSEEYCVNYVEIVLFAMGGLY